MARRDPYAGVLKQRTNTPQTQPIPGREAEMEQMESGGYAWRLKHADQVRRFLIIGSEGNQYYATEQEMTKQNAKATIAAIHENGLEVVHMITDVSHRGLAPKNDPAIFVLALCLSEGDADTVEAAIAAAPAIVRIQTHLNHLANYLKALGILSNWKGRAAINAVITGWTAEGLALNIVKYRQRDGWTLGQLLDLTHPKTESMLHNAGFWYANWVGQRDSGKKDAERQAQDKELPPTTRIWTGSKHDEANRQYHEITWSEDMPRIYAYELMRRATKEREVVDLIQRYQMPWETVPDKFINSPLVWSALLQHMKPEAMVRNLARMTANGTLEPMSLNTRLVAEAIQDTEKLRRARMHPLKMLVALLTYQQGHGTMGKLTWTPISKIIDALDAGFYNSFEAWEPTGLRRCLGIDVSGSMSGGSVMNVPGLTPNKVAGVMAMCIARKEPEHMIMGFFSQPRELNITPRQRLDDVCRVLQSNTFGNTDASALITWAMNHKPNPIAFDSFELFTDGQTWDGTTHPSQALVRYRKASGNPKVRMAMCAITSYPWTFADPKDPFQADFPGFASDTPKLLELFLRGEFDPS